MVVHGPGHADAGLRGAAGHSGREWEKMAKNGISRRNFMQQSTALAAAFAAGSSGLIGSARAQRETELNILCWEGYNSAQVLDPFREQKGATVKAESLTNDPTMINRLRAGETHVWDLINVNNPWARKIMWPEKLIQPLDRARFEPFFGVMPRMLRKPSARAGEAE